MSTTTIEAALLSGLLYRPDLIHDAMEIARPSDMIEAKHQRIYQAMIDMALASRFIDLLTLADEVGDMRLLTEIAANTQFGDVMEYARVCAAKSRLRKFNGAWQECAGIISNETIDLAARADMVADKLAEAVRQESVSGKTLQGRELFTHWYTELERLCALGETISGIKTRFVDLDRRTKGWHGDEMIVIAARPGMGKTNLAINFAWDALRQGKSVLYFSLEMSANQLMHRFAAQAESIKYDDVQTANLAECGHKVANFMAAAKEMPFFINDRAGQTMASIRSEAKKIKRRSGLDMVIIDHIGLISDKAKDQYTKMTEISRLVKLLAKELDVPVMALTQLNRAIEKRANPLPIMSDLRDSGAIEQDADVVLFPHRETDPDTPEDRKHIAALVIGKLRHGEPAIIPMITQFHHCRFLPADTDLLPSDWLKPKNKKGGYEL